MTHVTTATKATFVTTHKRSEKAQLGSPKQIYNKSQISNKLLLWLIFFKAKQLEQKPNKHWKDS